MSDEELYRKAEKRVDEKLGFYHHLYAFIAVNAMFIVLNLLTSPGEWWFYWITGFWAIGLIGHFFKVFVLTDTGKKDKMIEKEMEKMKK